MRNANLKNALVGVAIALVAAYLFPVLLAALLVGPRGLRLAFTPLPFRALYLSSWIVVPLGAALGVLIPRIAAGKRRWVAALHGAGYGATGGLAAMICWAAVFMPAAGPVRLWVAMVAYCAVWVGAYAYIRAKGPAVYR